MKYQSDKFQIRDKNLMIVLPRKEKKIALNRSLNTVGKMQIRYAKFPECRNAVEKMKI